LPAFILTLSYLRVDLSIVLVSLRALSIGLDLQTLASNYVAGLVLLSEKTIRDGDIIEVDNIRGTVLQTGLRAHCRENLRQYRGILPNSLLVSQRLDNWTKSDRIVRIEALVGVAYGSDVRAVQSLLQTQDPVASGCPDRASTTRIAGGVC